MFGVSSTRVLLLVCLAVVSLAQNGPQWTTKLISFDELTNQGSMAVPPGYGSIGGQADVGYGPNAKVYYMGGRMGLTHIAPYQGNNSFSIHAQPNYIVQLQSFKFFSHNAGKYAEYFYVTCGSTGMTDFGTDVMWPSVSSPSTIGLPNCVTAPSEEIYLRWGVDYSLALGDIEYRVIGYNPCIVDNGYCDNADCVYQFPGVRTCECHAGFQKSDITVENSCVEINECATNFGGCAPAAEGGQCDNHRTPRCRCAAGYTGNGFTCTDYNECEDPEICGVGGFGGTCSNTPGSYICTCQSGYSQESPQGQCQSNSACTPACAPSNSVCNSQGGSPTCQCRTGYAGDPLVLCSDVNECATENRCGIPAAATCNNTEGSHTCTCKPGFLKSGAVCIDINECRVSNGGCADQSVGTCENIDGGRICSCHTGYTLTLKPDGNYLCIPIDYCGLTPELCGTTAAGRCTNTPGSYSCSCHPGYARVALAATSRCENINECDVAAVGQCHCNCTDSIGSFECGINGVCPGDFATVGGGDAISGGAIAGITIGSLLLLIGLCVALVLLALYCRRRYERSKQIQRRLRHQAMEEELEMSPRETNGDEQMTSPEEGDEEREREREREHERARPLAVGLLGAAHGAHAARASGGPHHNHSSSSSEAADLEVNPQGGTKEGVRYVGAAAAADAEVGDGVDGDGIGPNGDFVLVVTPRNGVHPTDSAILIAPKIRVLRPDENSQEFKVARSPLAAAAMSAASVLAVSASGGRPRPSQPLPALQQPLPAIVNEGPAPAHAILVPQPSVAHFANVPPSPRRLPVVPEPQPMDEPMNTDGRDEEDEELPPRPAAANLQVDVPEDPYGGEHSRNSASYKSNGSHSNQNSQKMDGGVVAAAINGAHVGEPIVEEQQHENVPNPAVFEFDDEEDGEPTMAVSDKQKKDIAKQRKEAEKRQHAEAEKAKKQAKADEDKRKKEAKAEEDRRKREKHYEDEKQKKERKAAEKAEAARIKKEKAEELHAHKQAAKESSIKSKFAKFAQKTDEEEDDMHEAEFPLEDGDMLPDPSETHGGVEEHHHPAPEAHKAHDPHPAQDHTPKERHSPKEGHPNFHAEGRQPTIYEPGNGPSLPPSPSRSNHPHLNAFNFTPPEQGSLGGRTPVAHPAPSASGSLAALNVSASAQRTPSNGSIRHAKKHSNSHSNGGGDYIAPSMLLQRGSSHSVSANAAPGSVKEPHSAGGGRKSSTEVPPQMPPSLLRMTSEGIPRQRHSDSSTQIATRTLTLRDVLTGRNPRCLLAFSDFTKSESREDALKFYMAVEEYRHQKAEMEQKALNEDPEEIAKDMADKANEIFKQFLPSAEAKAAVGLPEDVAARLSQRSEKYHRTGVVDAVLLPADDGVGYAVAAFVSTVFDEAQEVVFKSMEADSWFRFMKTDRAREFES